MKTPTDDEIVNEARRLYIKELGASSTAHVAIRLVREGWAPVDPAVKLAREAAGQAWDAAKFPHEATLAREGHLDSGARVQAALAMYSVMIADGWVKP